ncbi:MAG: tRNA (adenosine(37)-N6)-threonylcarbamoyltransferase complex transferase subunit TsaD [bacterium]
MRVIKNFKKPISNEVVKIGPDSNEDQIIFAIETSCDETSAAIVLNGRKVLSNVVASQIDIHKKYGGVVPELAAREHLKTINIVIKEAIEKSSLKMEEITAFSATVGPGLVGALLVGLNAAKTLSLIYDKPFIGVNHLNAHVCANYLESDFEPPFICLLISGGHTQLILVNSYTEQILLGETCDDAIGETYDKVARLLGLPYPGGQALDQLAQEGDKNKFKFTKAKVNKYDFSFSGLKTAVLRLYQSFEKNNPDKEQIKKDIAASFQETVSEILLEKTLCAAKDNNLDKIALAGGVAANSEIRKKFLNLKDIKINIPDFVYCTDNAAMVAGSAYFLSNVTGDLAIEVFSRVKNF